MEPVSLTALAQDLLDRAGQARSGRAAHTIHGGRDHALHQTVLALLAGHELAEHDNPGDATLQVLLGHVRLTTPNQAADASAGDHLAIPDQRHGLLAVEDSVVVLTVVNRG